MSDSQHNSSTPFTPFPTRRKFIKHSALTVGAATLLSRGIALGNTPTSCTKNAVAVPSGNASGYSETTPNISNSWACWSKAWFQCVPASGVGKDVEIKIRNAGGIWMTEENSQGTFTPAETETDPNLYILHGWIDDTDCKFYSENERAHPEPLPPASFTELVHQIGYTSDTTAASSDSYGTYFVGYTYYAVVKLDSVVRIPDESITFSGRSTMRRKISKEYFIGGPNTHTWEDYPYQVSFTRVIHKSP